MATLPKADLVLTNGRVFAGAGAAIAQAVAIGGGRVLAVGSDSEIEALVEPGRTRAIDLRGRLATPGLFEAHLHLLPLGLTMIELDLRPARARTLDALLAAVRERAREAPRGAWVLARGYDQFHLDVGRHPYREELDAAAPDNPVYLVRTCGHVAVANSAALALAGIDEATPVPQGGAIERQNGRLTGLLAETGRDRLKAVLPDPTDAELVAAIERAGRACLAYGITSVMDAAVGMRAGFREIGAYRTALRERRLPVRANLCLLGGPNGILEEAHADGLVTAREADGFDGERLTVGPVKIFTDGSAGGRTAAMRAPYLPDRLGEAGTGLMLLKDEEMAAFVRDYHDRGYQLAVHAIGDAAIEQTLDAMEAALSASPDPDRRHRIEHCGFNDANQIARMARLGIEPVPQPVFMVDFGDLYVSVLGRERAEAAYPMRSWIAAGLHPAASSDAPVCDIDPFPNLYTMLTRKTSRGTVLGPGEAIDPGTAITAYTAFGAHVNRREAHVGRLAPGLLADVAVFSHDLTTADPEAIRREARCDLAISGGHVVHDAAGETG